MKPYKLLLGVAAIAAVTSVVMLAPGHSAAALPVGAAAPDFTASATLGGKPFSFHLADALKKGPVVLYFYPAAFTSGCTIEAHDFAEATASFTALGATVIGLSADPIEKLNRFSVSECRSKFAVASADQGIISGYKVKLPLIGMSNRTSFVIAPDSHILFAYSALNPTGHVEKTLAVVRAWRAAHPG
jgi:peroxiredoxin